MKGRLIKLKEEKEKYGLKRVQTTDEKISFKVAVNPSTKPKIYYE